jgi:sacsin
MKKSFDGTLFRFPFRNDATASASEISKKIYSHRHSLDELVTNFKKSITKTLLFLRNIRRVEIYLETNDEPGPKLQYYADVTDREAISNSFRDLEPSRYGLDTIRSIASTALFGSNENFSDWSAISNFIAGADRLSRDAFYSKLLRTPDSHLPKTQHVVTLTFVDQSDDEETLYTDRYLVCSALGAGKCRAMACNPEHREMKFLPWGSIAARLSRDGCRPPKLRGGAFCFLPLPVETGFSVHINGYFELSSNRRDIWFGDDMTGAGQIRSEWNTLLLHDVISPLYANMLLLARSFIGSGSQFYELWPTDVSSDLWKVVRSRVFQLSELLPLVYSSIEGGQWVNAKESVFLEEDFIDENSALSSAVVVKKKLQSILLEEKLRVVYIPGTIISCFKNELCDITEVNAAFIRNWFKRFQEHPALEDRENAIFLLRYCIDELYEDRQFQNLIKLPLLPLLDGSLGVINGKDSSERFFVVQSDEKYLLSNAASNIVDIWTGDTRLNTYLSNEDMFLETNIGRLDPHSFIMLLSEAYPPEWKGLPEVHWSQELQNGGKPLSIRWLAKVWDYILSENGVLKQNPDLLIGTLQIVPSCIGENDKTIQMLSSDLCVLNTTNLKTGTKIEDTVVKLLRSVGIRTLDDSIFIGQNKVAMLRILGKYTQPPNANGILRVLLNSIFSATEDEMIKSISARFKHLSYTDREEILGFLRDTYEESLTVDEMNILKALPIFEVFSISRERIFCHLSDNLILPPSCAERKHLDSRFIKATKRKDLEFMNKLGIHTMTARAYYTSYVPLILERDGMSPDERLSVISSALHNILEMSEDGDNEDFIQNMSDTKFILNSRNLLVRPVELYDPNEAGILQLVDESMLPNKSLRQATTLQSLRLLGMKSRLSIEGVLESARQIELQAKNIAFELGSLEGETILSIKNRSRALFNFLDSDDVIENFLNESSSVEESQVTMKALNDQISSSENKCADIRCLLSIAWLPVEIPPDNPNIELCPPRQYHGQSLVGVSSPEMTRPHSDAWLCSYSRDILSCNVKSERLSRLFTWDKSPPISVVSRQLVALSKMALCGDEAACRQRFSQTSAQIYAILDADLNDSDTMEKDETLRVLKEESWIWVGDKFVKTSQVAFDAPEHAKPFLYSVPDQMLCYENLLNHSGIRKNFSGMDFVYLLSSLRDELDGNACDSKKLDLAVFVARHLSRSPDIKLNEIDKSAIFLPSKDGKMFKACEMTYDDAPWLSSIIKKSQHIFVHPDVGNEVARVLGSKSLRDVLSAVQNGMIKIPSPKSESVLQLLQKRSFDDIEEHCKVLFELMEIAELRGTKQVTITFDMRNHGTMSLLHPCLASAQGPSLLVCFHGTSLEVDEVIRLTSPAKYYASIINGEGGAGGKGFSRFGRGFCGAFALTDCLQVVLGRSLLIFDPTGNFLIEDKTIRDDEAVYQSPRQKASNARNYGLSQSFCSQFPDQFEPFFSAVAGFKESFDHKESSASRPFFNGTILRIPFRSSSSPKSCIASKLFDQRDIIALQKMLVEKVSTCFLFTYHLQNVTIDVWDEDAMDARNLSASQVNSSPITRRDHLEEMSDSQSWLKDKTRMGKLFKAKWVPVQSSQFLEISTRMSATNKNVIDTYFIQSILAPPRLREMACTESLRSLKITPVVSLAYHLNRASLSEQASSKYEVPVGTLFSGFDTGIKTGLPFIINAPLFLHEWTGNLLFDAEDDLDFKEAFPGIRNVIISDSNNLKTTRTLALHVWNNQAITSALYELVPSTLRAITTCLENSWSRDPKLFYTFWPYYAKIHPKIKMLIDSNFYKALSNQKMPLYLTENDGFHTIDKGCFACPEYDLKESAPFFLRHMALFIAPRLVVEDLSRFGVNSQLLTPSVARSLLRNNLHVHLLSKQPSVALAVLEYCLVDLVDTPSFDLESSTTLKLQNEVRGLAILPMADGSIGKFGNNQIIATLQQQAMLRSIENKFLSPDATKILMPFVAKSGFLEMCRIENFGPKTLSDHICTVLPKAWESCDFVQWDHVHPSKLWIHQFWKEVSISNQDEVQLFRRWPLIPTLSGDLASCAHAPYILYLCPRATDMKSYLSLEKSYMEFNSTIQDIDLQNKVSRTTDERHYNPCAGAMPIVEEDFWKLGNEESSVESDDSSFVSPLPSTDGPNNGRNHEDMNGLQISIDGSFEVSTNQEIGDSEIPERTGPDDSNAIRLELNYDPNTDSFEMMHDILVKIQCPLLDASFINKEDARKLLSQDRLGVSRSIMTTLYQCLNYWYVPNTSSSSTRRLKWSLLSAKEYDQMLIFFSYHQQTRLSLMLSDLNLLKSLPLFETFAGTHISIQDGDSNFTTDASMDLNSVSTYIPLTLQSKILRQKPELKDLYEDLNVSVLNEAAIIEKFILKEFETMPLNQKEAVIKVSSFILNIFPF